MTDNPMRELRSNGESSVMLGVILFVLLGFSDRSIPPFPSSKPAVSGHSDFALRQVPVAEIRAAIEAYLILRPDRTHGVLTRSEQAELKELYEARDHVPLWVDASGRPDHSAHDALTLLRSAAGEGLDPADYRRGDLDRMTEALERESPLLLDVVGFDVALSSGMLRYLHHVHTGRVDPQTIGLRFGGAADHHDFAALLRSAVADHRVTETVAALRPPFEQYSALRAMLTRYRSLAADATLDARPPFAAVVHPGKPYAGLDVLSRRLVMLGDLPPGTPAPAGSTAYEGALVEGVRRFQVRHGLENDGILGQRTQAALRLPLAWRVRQIELALERLR